MNKNSRWFLLLLLFVLIAIFYSSCQQKEETLGPQQTTNGGAILAQSPLNPDGQNAMLSSPSQSSAVRIQPPEGQSFKFVIDEIQPAGKGKAYIGHVDGESGSSGTLVVIGSSISGTIRITGRPVFVLTSDRAGKAIIQAIDPSKLPPDHPVDYGKGPGTGSTTSSNPIGSLGDTCSTDDPTRVSAMILYTTDAKTAAGGTDAIEASIYAAIAEANQSYVNSDINMQLNLVRLAEVDYTSAGGNYLTDTCRLHDSGDGILDNVQSLRDTYRADLVAMVVPNSGSSCGLTYGQLNNPALGCSNLSNHSVVGSPANSHEEGAYHVFGLGCMQTNFTLPHEFGHSGSTRHDWDNDPTDNSPTHSNHGYYYDSGVYATSWRTILTYPSHNGSRVPYFSNPAISYLSHSTGISTGSQPADNHSILNTTRSVLANYRCSAPTPSNVWMKDSWGDTGAEPDPDTDIMYASPYIWTRRTQDTTTAGLSDRYQHEHQHENPILHQPTWAYVKLNNNGSTGASGQVKLYYANASTSLDWPGAWTLIGDVNVNFSDFAPGSTKVVEIPWTDPPGTGHYCLTARWDSPTDPIPPEASNIDANTRNSNNVIWKNLEILSTSGGDASTSFVAKPLYGRSFTLEFQAPGPRPFLPAGELEVTLKANGAEFAAQPGRGIVALGNGKYRVNASGTSMEVTMPNAESSAYVTVELRFHHTPKLENRTYRFFVNQYEYSQIGIEKTTEAITHSSTRVRVGGMAYEIQP
jgi:hypothetical protein